VAIIVETQNDKGETDNTRKFPFFGSRVDPYGSLLYTYDAYTTAKIDAGPAPPPPPSVGSDECCPPRLRMPFNSTYHGSKCVR